MHQTVITSINDIIRCHTSTTITFVSFQMANSGAYIYAARARPKYVTEEKCF